MENHQGVDEKNHRDRPASDAEATAKADKLFKVMKAFMAMKLVKTDGVPAEILPSLFLGSVGAAHNKQELDSIGITHILTVAADLHPRYKDDFEYLQIEIKDAPDADIKEHFESCIVFIQRALDGGGKVLVHCFAGKSRSSSVVIAYMMHTNGTSFHDALEHCQALRPIVQPNAGFCAQLLRFQRQGGRVALQDQQEDAATTS